MISTVQCKTAAWLLLTYPGNHNIVQNHGIKAASTLRYHYISTSSRFIITVENLTVAWSNHWCLNKMDVRQFADYIYTLSNGLYFEKNFTDFVSISGQLWQIGFWFWYRIAKICKAMWSMWPFNSIIYQTNLHMWYNFCLKIGPYWQKLPPNLKLQSSRLYYDTQLSHISTHLWLIYCERGPQYGSK